MDKSIERIIRRVLEDACAKGRDHLTQTELAARSLELRAATSLARLWQAQGKTTAARDTARGDLGIRRTFPRDSISCFANRARSPLRRVIAS